MEFRPIKAKDKDIFDKYLSQIDSRSCDMCFATLFLWRHFYNLEYTILHDMLVMRSRDVLTSFCYPIGNGDPVPVIEELRAYAAKHQRKLILNNVYKEHEELLIQHFPGVFQINYDRDIADYIYDCEKLQKMSGRKYHGKKNHINKFKRIYEDWSYEPVTQENLAECLKMLHEWKELYVERDNLEKNTEVVVSENYLKHREFLGQKAGLLRVDDRVVAFSVGEKINSDTFVVHVEKAYGDMPGVYPMICQQFLLHEAGDCTYVNREDDVGDEGLRKSKMSYHPLYLLEKAYAVEL